MYTKILVVLFLYVYAAGEDGSQSETEGQEKDNIQPFFFSNYSTEVEVSGQPTGQINKRQGIIRRTYDSNTFKLLTPIKEDDSKDLTDELKPDGHADGELQFPMVFITVNNRTKNTEAALHENNSSDLIQGDGTYNVQHYVRPPIVNNQYQMQYSPSYSNWEMINSRQNSRIGPCASSSVSRQYIQRNNYGSRSYSEYDPYQAEGTYSSQYYMPSYQQRKQISIEHQRQVALNNWRRLNYKNQASFVDPCQPNHLNFPSVDRQYIHNYPDSFKPSNIYSPEQNIHPYGSPPSNTRGHNIPSLQVYVGALPPQNVNNLQNYPPQTFIDSHRPPFANRMKGFITPPPYTIKHTPPKEVTPPPVYTPIPGSKTKSFTPTWPKVTPPPYTSTWPKVTPPSYTSTRRQKITPTVYTPMPGSRTKSYTPPVMKTTATHYTTPGWKTTSTHHTPPGRNGWKTTPTHYTPQGKMTTATHYTPPRRKTTTAVYTPHGRRTTPTSGSRTKSYTPPWRKTTPNQYTSPGWKSPPTRYTPPGRNGWKTTPTGYIPPGRNGWKTTPSHHTPSGWKTPPPTRSRTKSHVY